jgi:hypothetical protein
MKFTFNFSKHSTDHPNITLLNASNPTTMTTTTSRTNPNFPRVHGWNESRVTDNIDKTQIRLWQQVSQPKIFVYLWNGTHQEDAAPTVEQLQETIANILQIPPPTVMAPTAAVKNNSFPTPPICYLTTGITEATANILLNKQFWSTPNLTFFAIPFTPPTSTFICALDNLKYPEAKHEEVEFMAKTAIWENLQARDHVEALDPSNDKAFPNVVNSLIAITLPMLVKGGERKKIVWNIYLNPPSDNPDLHSVWSKIITETTFTTALYRITKPRPHPHCVGCKSLDHPTGLCPFPKQGRSFANPLHVTLPPEYPQGTGRGRGRGNRGDAITKRGRGCGRGNHFN